MGQPEPLLQIDGVTKSFAGLVALHEATLSIDAGEVHALIGQNGAGKSTLIKTLTGVYRRDAGSIRFAGAEIDFTSPHQAQAHGLSTIYQEVNLIPFRSVSENIFMGREPRRFGLINWRQMNSAATALLSDLGVHIDVTQPLQSYNIAIQQMVAVARAVSFKSRLVVMDEPTSSLDVPEVEMLFKVIRQLKQDGVAVIFVSHRLDELYAVCDRISIMRDGRMITTQPIHELSKLELVALMLGKPTTEVAATARPTNPRSDNHELLLQASHLRRDVAIQDVDLKLHRGEVVGLAGLLGSGRTEVARMLFGADAIEGGELHIDGQPVRFGSPADAIRAGIGFCSEDRKTEGIIPQLSVRDNLTLAIMPMLTRRGILSRARQQAIVDQFIKRLRIKLADAEQPISELSGGNQQKVLLARWLCMNPQVLILDEPTRGIDVGAKGEIQQVIQDLAGAGLGVLLIASEIEELIDSSDEVVVLRDGRRVAALEGDALTSQAVMAAMAQGAAPDYEEVLHG